MTDSTRSKFLARIETYLAAHPWASVRAIAEELPRPVCAPLDCASVSSLLLALKRRGRVESRRQTEGDEATLGYRLTAAGCPVTQELRAVQDFIHPDVPARAVLLADVQRRREERRALLERFAPPTPCALSPSDQLVEDCR